MATNGAKGHTTAMRNNNNRQSALPDLCTQLLTTVKEYMGASEIKHVTLALHFAQESFDSAQRDVELRPRMASLQQAVAVAIILAHMHIDAIGIAAGLVFEAIDAELSSLENIEATLGSSVARVVGSMLRLNILERKKQNVSGTQLSSPDRVGELENKKRRNRETLQRQQAETVRRMFVAMAEDPRVVMIKLAYRLHLMRTYRVSLQQRQSNNDESSTEQPHDEAMYTTAQETREIYAPLAGRLGMSLVESELEDLAFEILEPKEYAWVCNQVEVESKQWRVYVDRVCTLLREEMAAIGVQAEISGRVKHLYSFYQKILRTASEQAGDTKHLAEMEAVIDLSQIHDLIAFRIIVLSTVDCYVALGHVHSLWKPKEGRIKDFIANPKPNGYSALHTTVFCLDDRLVEIQIRTVAMHEMAEYGVAMHWHYKDAGDTASASAKELLTWLHQLSDWQHELRSSSAGDTEFVEAVKDDIFQEQIFVFTPKGEVRDLPVGSTPIDFAYRIHSKLGDTCAGARIITNSSVGGERLVTRMVSLDYELKNGEIVDIVTHRTAHPTRDWLNFARTAAARSKIRRYLKMNERDINVQIGHERLERELKVQGTRDPDILTEDLQDWLAKEYGETSFEDLLAAIGSDEVRPHAVAMRLTERWQQLHEQRDNSGTRRQQDTRALQDDKVLTRAPITKPLSSVHLEVDGVSGLLTRLANCCCPLPDDEIVGFISRGKGVIVHQADCQNLSRYRKDEQERIIPVSWVSMSQQRYLAPITITARNRPGLLHDVASSISEVGVNMTSVFSNVKDNKEIAVIHATTEVEGLEQVQRIFKRLEKIKEVLYVERDLRKRKKG